MRLLFSCRSLATLPRRSAMSGRWIAVLITLSMLPATSMAGGSPAGLTLGDDLGPVASLEIGRSLFARVDGAPPGSAVRLRILDEVGWTVAEAAAQADADGSTGWTLTWVRSGVVGCDCGAEVETYGFRRVEDAVGALGGRSFSVLAEDAAGQQLAATSFDLTAPSRPLAWTADGSGCPRFVFQPWEDIFVALYGSTDHGTALGCEARAVPAGAPAGTVWVDPPPWPSVRWPPDIGGNAGMPQILRLLPADGGPPGPLDLWFRCDDLPGINSGLLILDHACPPPPPPPPDG